jgi:pyruvate dehydrogenase E2 component (dihydrolipoamide acetyltransferase)
MDVLMPQLGETVAEGKITKWFKGAGETVKPGDNLFEIETDKVSMEVPSTTAGILSEIRIGVGEVAPVGAIVAVISGDGTSPAASERPSDPSAAPSMTARLTVAPAPASVPGSAESVPIRLDPFFEVRTPSRNFGSAKLPGGIATTPLARRLAAESGIDIGRVSGSGPHGRVMARDIDVERSRGAARAPSAKEATLSAEDVKSIYRSRPFAEIPLDAMRRTIAARLLTAKQSIPHFYLTADVEIGRLLKLREEANAAAPADKNGKISFKLSINDFIIKAWASALVRVPAANAVWAVDRILRLEHADIAVAVAIEGGLITPVIRDAELKTLTTISAEMRELAARARERRLQPGEYQGGSSSVSNLGMYGVREFAAIIDPPQATMLAVGAARRQAIELADGSAGFASMMTVTLSCDHRVVDGALGAELLAAFKALIETPVRMLV